MHAALPSRCFGAHRAGEETGDAAEPLKPLPRALCPPGFGRGRFGFVPHRSSGICIGPLVKESPVRTVTSNAQIGTCVAPGLLSACLATPAMQLSRSTPAGARAGSRAAGAAPARAAVARPLHTAARRCTVAKGFFGERLAAAGGARHHPIRKHLLGCCTAHAVRRRSRTPAACARPPPAGTSGCSALNASPTMTEDAINAISVAVKESPLNKV